jgi:hypothetical protein
MVREDGVFQNMKVVSLLILWSLPLLPTGDHAPSLPWGRGDARHAADHVNSPFIQHARDNSCPGDPFGGSLSGSLEEEEDSLEDVFLDSELLLSRMSPNRGPDALSSFAYEHQDLRRTPSQPHPLRC